jgi:epoxyqueuosine reductase
LRNAAIVLGNRPTPTAIPALIRGLNDNESLVRSACAWALGRYDEPAAADALRFRRSVEADETVIGEIGAALSDAIDSAKQLGTESTA